MLRNFGGDRRSWRLRILAIVAVLCCAGAPPCGADELAFRAQIKNHTADLFMNERFEELDRMAEYLRSTGNRSESGLWTLTFFYSGIADLAGGKTDDQRYWSEIEAKAKRWTTQSPRSPAAQISYSILLEKHAWSIRGFGWSREVRPEDWQPFREYIERARLHLLECKDTADVDPRWYETMLDIARAQKWEVDEFEKLVDEASARHPYFYPIYFSAAEYLLPKWYGSGEKIEALAGAAVEKTRPEDGAGMYARIYWYASQAEYHGRLFTESPIDWNRMRQGIEDVLKQYPDGWNINNFAHFACRAWDRSMTRDLIGRIEGEPIADAWESPAQYRRCKAWALRDPTAGRTAQHRNPQR